MTTLKILIFIFIIAVLITSIIIGIYILFLNPYLIRHPIKISHPFPSLTKTIPFLDYLDDSLYLTAGFQWYEVKEKNTNKKYLINFDGEGIIKIIDEEKRDEWTVISREEYNKRFE